MKYLIDFHHGVTEAQIDAYLDQYGYTFLQEWDNFERVILVESDVEPVKTDLVEYVVRDDHLEIRPQMADSIELNKHFISTNVPGLPSITINNQDEKDWWKTYILIQPDFDSSATEISRKGQNVSVYIMDSGLNADSTEFEGVNITNLYTVTPDDFTDQKGHGTAIASIIAGNTCGITKADIKVVKIFRTDRGTYQSEFLSALDAILADCPDNTYAVVNCSWSIPRNYYIESKMREMIFKGIWVLAASGNNGTPIDDVTPAAMDEVLTIGSFSPDLVPSTFSDYTGGSHISYTQDSVNHGELDGWAPGEKIWCLDKNNNYGYAAGTSMACAVASAVLAYNLTDYLDSNKQRWPGKQQLQLNSFAQILVKRTGLLDFSDPKYSDSKNRIVTLLDKMIYDTVGTADEFVVLSYTDRGVKELVGLLNVHTTKEAKWLDPLPKSFFMQTDGYLYGNPTKEDFFTTSDIEGYKKFNCRLEVTMDDDEVVIKNVTIYVIDSEFEVESLDSDHEIRIALLANCTGVTFFCPAGSAPSCFNFCEGGNTCCGIADKNSDCICVGFL
jgi:hypothetical protein